MKVKFDIEKYLKQGEQRRWKEADDEYGSNAGKLRGGNSGCVTKSGSILGKCHRISLASYLGCKSADFDDSKRRMFDSGFWNEDQWELNLRASDLFQDGYQILREEECPVTWKTVNPATGEEVEGSGRPDLMVVKPNEDYVPPVRLSSGEVVPAKNYTPICGFELKKISSAWRANRVHVTGDPSTDYCIQAANYSHLVGKIPWYVSFTSYDSHDVYYQSQAKFGARKIQPQRKHFHLTWDNDTLLIDGVPTMVTGKGIENYYALILEMESAKDLGPRPSNKNCIPKGKDQFDPCSNCFFAEECDKYEDNYEDWVAAVRHKSKEIEDE